MSTTIAAIATAPMDGAIAIIRISGPDTYDIVTKIAHKDFSQTPGYTIHYGHVYDGEKVVDEVLFNVYHAPKSYTGEELVEIMCHGGVFLTKKILTLLLANGAVLAQRGEFTQRAFLNGKMDLSQAEGVNDLIKAQDDLNAQSALHAVHGSINRILAPLVDGLAQIIAQIEVNIDYPEYNDVEQLVQEDILPHVQLWKTQMEALIAKSKEAMHVRQGIRTVILGRPNVGKSSLLNALLQEDKAIVTNIAGTTRDLVEGVIDLGDLKLHLIDTAGIHESQDVVEQIGIERSKQALASADLAIVVLDATSGITDEDQAILDASAHIQRIIVYNKNDLHTPNDRLSISALNHDIQPLIDRILEMFSNGVIQAKEDTLNNERQVGLAMASLEAMKRVEEGLNLGASPDLVTYDLQEAWQDLKAITGQSSRENLLDEIFSRFCLGK